MPSIPGRDNDFGNDNIEADALPEKTRAWLGQWRFPEADFARDASFEPRRFVECICGEEGLRAGPGIR